MPISASVGLHGVNQMVDVQTVQNLLLGKGYMVVPYGLCDQLTISAITTFQGGFLSRPDGRIDPGGNTWRRLSAAASGPSGPGNGSGTGPGSGASTPAVRNEYLELLPRPGRELNNVGLTAVSNSFMIGRFGQPRENYSQDDQPITNARLRTLMKTDSVGPFRVNGMAAAVESLKLVFADIREAYPDLYEMIGFAGMLVVRNVRGSTTSISNHSWGTAIDLKIDGILDRRGDDRVQKGLTLIAPIFNTHQWYWGVNFGTEDAMHFECSRQLVETFPT